jgi:hypothetical protein
MSRHKQKGELGFFLPLHTIYNTLTQTLKNPIFTHLSTRHFFGCNNFGVTGTEMQGTISLVRELARQLGLSEPGIDDRFEFLAKADAW